MPQAVWCWFQLLLKLFHFSCTFTCTNVILRLSFLVNYCEENGLAFTHYLMDTLHNMQITTPGRAPLQCPNRTKWTTWPLNLHLFFSSLTKVVHFKYGHSNIIMPLISLIVYRIVLVQYCSYCFIQFSFLYFLVIHRHTML